MSTLKVNELDTKSGTVITVAAGKTLDVTLADDAISAAQIATDAVTADAIAANAVDSSEIAAGAVTNAKTDFQPGTTFKGDGSSADGKITLNCSQNTHGVSIQSPAHASAASYTLTLPTTDGSADEFMQTDGSGVLTWAAVAGGLSRMDTWMLDTDMNITSNGVTLLSDFTHSSDAGYSNYMVKNVGAAFAAPSTGVFTFPETGTWQASFSTYTYAHNGYYTQLRIWVDATADNGSNWYTNAIASNEVANTTYGGSRVTSGPLNISDLSNDKVRFQFRRHYADAGYIYLMAPGNTSSTGMAAIGTFVTFTKLA